MTNERFNNEIKRMFNSTSNDDVLSNLLMEFWINHDLTDEQTRMLNEMQKELEEGLCSCYSRYLI